jgi:hypothetical protein
MEFFFCTVPAASMQPHLASENKLNITRRAPGQETLS